MSATELSEPRLRFVDLLAMGLVLLPAMLVAGYGHLSLGIEILDKGHPDFSVFGVLKILTAFLAAYGLVAVGTKLGGRAVAQVSPYAQPATMVSMAILLATTLAVIFVPRSLNHFVRELQPLSILTEVVLVAALGFLALGVRASLRNGQGRLFGLNGAVIYSLMFAAVFLILMEETSWGQHWIGFGTPEAFRGNLQNETNLHNFYTYRFELVYYSMAVIGFVLLPAFWPRRSSGLLSAMSFYVPPVWFALFALPVCGLMYESWNILPYQTWFFCGALVAVCICRRNSALRVVGLVQLALLVLSQIVFVLLGHRMEDGYELSEVREFFISVLIAGYALVVWRRAAGPARAASST